VLALVCAGLAVAASSDALHEGLLTLLTAAGSIMARHPVLGVSVFVVISALSAMLAFFSTAIVVPAAVVTWGKPVTMALLWLGWMLGGAFAYGVGRGLGRPVVSWFVSVTMLERLEHRMSARLPFGLVLLFQMAVPSEIPGYLLGLVRYPFAKFMIALSIAEFPFAIATVYLGASFLERKVTLLVTIGMGTALFSAWALHTLQKRLSA